MHLCCFAAFVVTFVCATTSNVVPPSGQEAWRQDARLWRARKLRARRLLQERDGSVAHRSRVSGVHMVSG
jgi:hypothetical protein